MSGKLTFIKQSKTEEMKLIRMSPYVHKDPIMTSQNFERMEMHVFEAPKI